MLSTKSGATFNEEDPNMTFVVRKEVIEIVYKVKPGLFQIINFARYKEENGLLFANWGNYLSRVTKDEELITKLMMHCPTLCELLMGLDKDGVEDVKYGLSIDDCAYGFGIDIKISNQLPLQLCITPEIENKANMLRKKMLKVYNEIVSNVPWKTGLNDVWEP